MQFPKIGAKSLALAIPSVRCDWVLELTETRFFSGTSGPCAIIFGARKLISEEAPHASATAAARLLGGTEFIRNGSLIAKPERLRPRITVPNAD